MQGTCAHRDGVTYARTQKDGPRREATLDTCVVNVMYLYAFIHALGTIIQKTVLIVVYSVYVYNNIT